MVTLLHPKSPILLVMTSIKTSAQKTNPALDLHLKCLHLIEKTYVELGQKGADAEKNVALATILAQDLLKDFKILTDFTLVEKAFADGVRNSEAFVLCPRTWYKWLKPYKEKATKNYLAEKAKEQKLLPELSTAEKERQHKVFITDCILIPYQQFCSTGEFEIRSFMLGKTWKHLNKHRYALQSKERMQELYKLAKPKAIKELKRRKTQYKLGNFSVHVFENENLLQEHYAYHTAIKEVFAFWQETEENVEGLFNS